MPRDIYSNCLVLSPDDIPMFRCAKHRAEWYLNHEAHLAEVVEFGADNQPMVIRLTFEPEGLGKAGDDFYLQTRESKCVVCGTREDITKHHVVPLCYRRHTETAGNNHHDILPVCETCHRKYERRFAWQLRLRIAKEYDAPVEGTINGVDKNEFFKYNKIAHALVAYRKKMPPERIRELELRLSRYLGHTPDREELERLSLDYRHQGGLRTHGAIVAKKIEDIDAFYVRWRQHFVDTMQPQHLPEHWSITRSITEEMSRDKQGRVAERQTRRIQNPLPARA